jgi:UDP-N-acetyl-D-glucosamine dehydrogenase
MRVGVIGQGYVGLTISIAAVKVGHSVVGVDLSSKIVGDLSNGKSHIEGISDSEIAEAIAKGGYSVSSDFGTIKDCDVIVIAVPTPLSEEKLPDLGSLKSATKRIGESVGSSKLIINESTSFPGTLREVIKPIIDGAGDLNHLFAVSPERVDPGNATFGTRNTPRLVGGLTDEARDKAIQFYSTFCDEVVAVSSAEVAEAAKLLENSFRFVNISFVNEFAKIMHTLDIPVDQVIQAAATKPYGFMSFTPTVGIGGHCIPVDPIYLQKVAEESGRASHFIELSERTNTEMPTYVAGLLSEISGGLSGKRVLVAGVSYKPDVADTRESSAEPFIDELKRLGARVSWHDPLVKTWKGEKSANLTKDFDLCFVLTAHESLDLSNWAGGPIYTLMPSTQHPEWISLLGDR